MSPTTPSTAWVNRNTPSERYPLLLFYHPLLEHQIEQLHRLRDLGFRHWFERSRSWQRTHRITPTPHPQRHLLRQINRLHQNRRDDRDLEGD
ncbi:MAG TPA: hypothetical protein VHT00_14395 [Stellaceae bacterium]|nr:hypothetical protein [Stellaceae bacterium]